MKDNVVSWRSCVVVSSNKKLCIVHHSCSPDCLPHGTISETMCVSPYPTSSQHRHEFISVWATGDNTDKLVSLLWKGCWGVSEKATGYLHQVVGVEISYRSPATPSGHLFCNCFHWVSGDYKAPLLGKREQHWGHFEYNPKDCFTQRLIDLNQSQLLFPWRLTRCRMASKDCG